MKLCKEIIEISFFLIPLCIFGLSGCYPLHKVKDYKSKELFYAEARKSIEDKNVIITLAANDSSISAADLQFQDDTIQYLASVKWSVKSFYPNEIASVKYPYSNSGNSSGIIYLQNGDSVLAHFIMYNPKIRLDCKVVDSTFQKFTLKEIKSISYRNYFGIPLGFLVGGVTGYLGGNYWYIYKEEKSREYAHTHEHYQYDNLGYLLLPRVVFPVAGLIAGWIIGGRTTWEFGK